MEKAHEICLEMFAQRGYKVIEKDDEQILAVKKNGNQVCAFMVNIPKFNGIYISNYFYNDNYINQTQKELVVYYTGVSNKCRIKVTYLDYFNKVIIECVK